MVYRAAAALPHDDRESAIDVLRGQLRIMAVAAGATPDWTTLAVAGPTEMFGAEAPTRFEWTASVDVPGAIAFDALPELDVPLLGFWGDDATRPFDYRSAGRSRV